MNTCQIRIIITDERNYLLQLPYDQDSTVTVLNEVLQHISQPRYNWIVALAIIIFQEGVSKSSEI